MSWQIISNIWAAFTGHGSWSTVSPYLKDQTPAPGGMGFIGACSSDSAPGKTDPTPPPPPPKPQCDAFAKDQSLFNVDQDSFDAFNLMWPGNPAASNFKSWRSDSRLFFGAAEELIRPSCEKKGEYSNGPVANLMKGASTFLGAHYSEADDSVNGSILFLMGGLASSEVKQEDIFSAYDALAREKQGHKDFAELMKAAWWFNKAAEKADKRFTAQGPVASGRMNKQDKAEASAALDKAVELLKGVREEGLIDRQRDFLRVLRGAIASYRKTLGGGSVIPPPPKPTGTGMINPF